MGKATITGGGANGLYNISIKYDNARAKARLDAINSQLDTLSNTSIPDALAVKNAAKAQHDTALGYLNDYLNSVTPEQFDPTISGRLTVQAMQTKSVYDEANKAYKKLVLQETALEKEKTKLQNVPEDESAQAWCADFTEDLSGDVGVIDVGYEDKDIRIIKPHAIEGAGYNAAADGIISSFFNHTAHQLYTNRAYLPAMAKWKPRYRTGSITSLTGDTCTVSLDPYKSSQQTLDINQSTSLTDVPIEYMTCNGAAFQVGDSVVVDFSLDWATPRVIGFVSNPKRCKPPYQQESWSPSLVFTVGATFNISNDVNNDLIFTRHPSDLYFINSFNQADQPVYKIFSNDPQDPLYIGNYPFYQYFNTIFHNYYSGTSGPPTYPILGGIDDYIATYSEPLQYTFTKTTDYYVWDYVSNDYVLDYSISEDDIRTYSLNRDRTSTGDASPGGTCYIVYSMVT